MSISRELWYLCCLVDSDGWWLEQVGKKKRPGTGIIDYLYSVIRTRLWCKLWREKEKSTGIQLGIEPETFRSIHIKNKVSSYITLHSECCKHQQKKQILELFFSHAFFVCVNCCCCCCCFDLDVVCRCRLLRCILPPQLLFYHDFLLCLLIFYVLSVTCLSL